MKKFKRKFASSKLSFLLTYLWSRFLNFCVSHWEEHIYIAPALDTTEANERIGALIWTEDAVDIWGQKIYHGWMRTPQHVQDLINRGLLTIGDCDEFAAYACEILKDSFNVFNPRMMTIRWQLADGTIEGHNTCVFTYLDKDMIMKYGRLCNWGLRKSYVSTVDIANFFAKASEGALIAYTEISGDLKIISHVKIK